MEIIKHKVAKEIDYFDLREFVNKIKLSSKVLDHMENTNKSFDDYFSKLSQYDDELVLYFWIALAYEEIKNSNYVENNILKKFDFTPAELFVDRFSISNSRIHKIHEFVLKDEENKEKVGTYRKTPIKVSNIEKDYEEIFWYGVKPEDIKAFMSDFIEIYKSKNTSVLTTNPFLKSALMHLLFLKIHPYHDGNGRTARMLHNMKFTEIINRNYDMHLKISPINLSERINVYKPSYVKPIDNIYFDLKHDNNAMINKWFNFILNMYDEQLYVNRNLIDNMDEIMDKIQSVKEHMSPETIHDIENKYVRTLKK